MTPAERKNPSILNGSRRLRIANGCGLKVFDVNQLIKRYNETKKMVKKLTAQFEGKGGKFKKRKKISIPGMGSIDLSKFMDMQ
ncbi:MAG: hypothetical protein MJ189_04235 [Coriobacteriales bacterium]|nr:hypothetical protein [Coriobacteriales bacterium]